MTDESPSPPPPSCPSARPEMAQSVIFGVVGGTVAEPRVGYLEKALPVTPEILALSGPVAPGEVFRFAAPCAGGGCQHFDGARCRLAQRVVAELPVAVDRLPPCRLRPTCVWWKQEGVEACRRCPQIVSENLAPTAELVLAATP
ncbi:MAG TPA: nitrogen fixation protein [Thermoanaerobaculia bacterium]|nr:nitrogen fixation protein [Thermoanaerobaculia bacterium]